MADPPKPLSRESEVSGSSRHSLPDRDILCGRWESNIISLAGRSQCDQHASPSFYWSHKACSRRNGEILWSGLRLPAPTCKRYKLWVLLVSVKELQNDPRVKRMITYPQHHLEYWGSTSPEFWWNGNCMYIDPAIKAEREMITQPSQF